MKREILFRGKRVDNGNWMEGMLMIVQGRSYIFPKDKLFFAVMFSYHDEFEVIPETVGQFTGLTDIRGVKMFDDDICRDERGDEVNIEFKNGRYPWEYDEYPEYWEIIGSIHDN